MPKRLGALDGLRGVAALVVVVYHTLRFDDHFSEGIAHYRPGDPLSTAMTVTPLRAIFDGPIAVWIFFVLSGYVLSRRFWRGERQRWGRYAVRRAVRLYLPLWGSAVVAVGLLGLRQHLDGTGDGFVDLSAVGSSTGRFFTNLGLFTMHGAPVNGVWWSMRWEVWFSALLPLLLGTLAVLGCGPRRRFRSAPLLLLGMFALVSVAFQPALVRAVDLPLLVRDAPLYLPMFGVGVALAAFEDQLVGSSWWRKPARGWLVLLVALMLIGMRGPLGSWRAAGILAVPLATGVANVLALVGATLIVVLCVGWPAGGRALQTRPIAWVGTRSYSLYLIHLPLLNVLAVAFGMRSAPLWFIGLVVAVSLAATAGFYRLVEAPTIRITSWISQVGRPQVAGSSRPAPAGQPAEPASLGWRTFLRSRRTVESDSGRSDRTGVLTDA